MIVRLPEAKADNKFVDSEAAGTALVEIDIGFTGRSLYKYRLCDIEAEAKISAVTEFAGGISLCIGIAVIVSPGIIPAYGT